MSKKYGLIVPGKVKTPQLTFQASRNVFGNDSDSDDDSRKPMLLRPSDIINRQAKISQNKAMVEDPTVFQYDEVYDDIKSEKEVKKEKTKEDRKPKYIENLMKAANKRKIENERRVERQIQKEREEEGDEYADKEVFVTSAYKKKLEELSQEEEREKHEEYLESIGDVTKQKDLGGFYRHLYEQKLGSEKKTDYKEVTEKNSSVKQDDSESESDLIKKQFGDEIRESSKKRNYRKRKSSTDLQKHLSEGEIEESDEEINHLNLDDIKKAKTSKQSNDNIDADSDFSIDESSDENETEMKDDKPEVKELFKKPDDLNASKIPASTDKNLINKPIDSKPKIDIWKKRTIGEVFEQALKRYYERKASRGI